jgi:hypothetical protein
MQKNTDREHLLCLFPCLDLSVFLQFSVFLEDTFRVTDRLVGVLISGEADFFILLVLIEELEAICFLFGHLHSLCLQSFWDRGLLTYLYTLDHCLFVFDAEAKVFLKNSIFS